jgi:hypothetical protein
MSISVMSHVWKNYCRGGSHKLAMLALADWCNDEGGSLHPSIAGIAKKINVSESQARRIIHEFIEEGYLKVVANHLGGNPGQSRHYKLNVKKLSIPCMGTTPSTDATPSIDARYPLHGCALPLAPTTPDSPLTTNNHHGEKDTLATPDGFATFWEKYPKHPRKEGRGKCLELWISRELEAEVEKILPHLEYKKEEWLTGDNKFLQKPFNYLDQASWDGWEQTVTARKNQYFDN